MGAQVHIRLASDKQDEEEKAPFLGSNFQYEICNGSIWDDKPPFLSKSEVEILKAPLDDSFADGYPPPIAPTVLENVFYKVLNYLKENEDYLPFEIDIDYEKMDNEGLDYELTINNTRCWIQGDSKCYKVTDKVRIINFPHETGKVEMWIPIADEVEVDGKKYYLKKTTRYKEYKERIEQVIDFCKYAQRKNEKIYWYFSH